MFQALDLECKAAHRVPLCSGTLIPILQVRKLRLRPKEGLFKIVEQMVVEPALDLDPKVKLWVLYFPRPERAHSRKQQAWTEPYQKVPDSGT